MGTPRDFRCICLSVKPCPELGVASADRRAAAVTETPEEGCRGSLRSGHGGRCHFHRVWMTCATMVASGGWASWRRPCWALRVDKLGLHPGQNEVALGRSLGKDRCVIREPGRQRMQHQCRPSQRLYWPLVGQTDRPG